jgi:hypothetical protein
MVNANALLVVVVVVVAPPSSIHRHHASLSTDCVCDAEHRIMSIDRHAMHRAVAHPSGTSATQQSIRHGVYSFGLDTWHPSQ